MDFNIRQAEEKDIIAIATLDKLCFSLPWSLGAFEREIRENDLALYIVAEVNDMIVGYAGLWRIVDEGHITNVAVHPDFRKMGFGETLVSLLIDCSREAGIITHTLEVRASNIAAIALYSKLGFVSAGIRQKYYQDNNEDAIIMWRTE